MSSQSNSPERTLNRVVRAGVTVANAARRRRTRRRARRRTPPPSLPSHPQPNSFHSPSLSVPEQLLLSTHPHPQTRRQNDLRQTLLSFPEHDPSTITTLLNHYHGDRDRVIEKLSQARTAPIPPKPNPITTPPQSQSHVHVHDRLTPKLAPSALSPPPLTLTTQPRHHRRPSRRFSREAAAPLWAAAVRTTGNNDLSSLTSTVNTHPETPRIAGSKRPRRSPTASDTTDTTHASASSCPDLHAALTTGLTVSTSTKKRSPHDTPVAATNTAPSQAIGTSLFPAPPNVVDMQPEHVQLLVRRVTDLEAALSRFLENVENGRTELGRKVQSAQLEMGALERRHETLEHDLEDNRKRVSKTEQYLDTMRRDVRYAIGAHESRFFVIVRQGMNGLVYYLLAYLVPVLFFCVRAFRGLVVAIRRRFKRQ